jgi:hypothetical protein
MLYALCVFLVMDLNEKFFAKSHALPFRLMSKALLDNAI